MEKKKLPCGCADALNFGEPAPDCSFCQGRGWVYEKESSVDKRLSIEDLSPDQLRVYESIIRWSESPRGILTVGGYAGTGKSTLLGVFASDTQKRVAYVTYTGRASSVLQRKLKAQGVKVTGFDEVSKATVGTLHQLLYVPVTDEETEELHGFSKRGPIKTRFDLIVIDEASMVGGQMLADVMEHEVPVLAVGDHGQLPPVMDTGELMKNPELRLEKIHRQAEGDPIIKLSQIIRETGRLDRSLCSFRRKFEIDDVLRDAYAGVNPLDVGVLCWTNRMRIWLNEKIRKVLGHEGPLPRAGEIVMCLKNDPPIYNGMRGVLQTDTVVGSNPWLIDSEIAFPEEGVATDYVSMSGVSFNRERTFQTLEDLQRAIVAAGYIPEEWASVKKAEAARERTEHAIGCPDNQRCACPVVPGRVISTEEATWLACISKVRSFSSAGHPYDFGYAMTVHKSQGSQFKHAIFFLDRQEKPLEEDWRRFAYTAVTRASERLTVIA
jgi:hypothetical protein